MVAIFTTDQNESKLDNNENVLELSKKEKKTFDSNSPTTIMKQDIVNSDIQSISESNQCIRSRSKYGWRAI